MKAFTRIGVIAAAALAMAGCRPAANDRVDGTRARSGVAQGATGGSGTDTYGTDVLPPANTVHQQDSLIHESHPSTRAENTPNWSVNGDEMPPQKSGRVLGEDELGVGGSGKAGMAARKGDAGTMDGGTGGSGHDELTPGFDGLGTDVRTDQGIKRDVDKGTPFDNGTSKDLKGTK